MNMIFKFSLVQRTQQTAPVETARRLSRLANLVGSGANSDVKKRSPLYSFQDDGELPLKHDTWNNAFDAVVSQPVDFPNMDACVLGGER